jgi:hypothetical protein
MFDSLFVVLMAHPQMLFKLLGLSRNWLVADGRFGFEWLRRGHTRYDEGKSAPEHLLLLALENPAAGNHISLRQRQTG